MLALAWATQGVPLLAHLSNDQPDSAPHASRTQQPAPSDQAQAGVADAEHGRHHHNPLDCHTCKTLLPAGPWAVPHVPRAEFFGRAPIRFPLAVTPELALSREFRTLAAPRGPPSLSA